jgi:hypothetical protein
MRTARRTAGRGAPLSAGCLRSTIEISAGSTVTVASQVASMPTAPITPNSENPRNRVTASEP